MSRSQNETGQPCLLQDGAPSSVRSVTVAAVGDPTFSGRLQAVRALTTVPAPHESERKENPQSKRGSPQSGGRRNGGTTATDKTTELLDTTKVPVGSFAPETWRSARKILDWWIRLETPGSIKIALQLLERSVLELKDAQEKEETDRAKEGNWVCNKKLTGRLVRSWKNSAEKGKSVTPAIALTSRLLNLSSILPEFPFDVKAFSVILGVAVNQSTPEDVLFNAETLLSVVMTAAATTNSGVKPNVVVWNQVLRACKKSSLREAPEQADAVLQLMKSQETAPDRLTFESLINVHAVAGNTARSEEVFQEMMEECQGGNEKAKPGTFSCNMVLLSYLKATDRGAAQRAVQLLDLMSQDAIPDVRPDYVSYNTVMECFARAGDFKGVETIMERLKENLGKDSEPNVKQTANSYAIHVEAWTNARNPNRAEEMLREILDKSLTDPTLRMFNAALKAWANSNSSSALERARDVLSLLQTNETCIALGILPNVDSFNAILGCIANANQADAGKESEETLRTMAELFRDGNTSIKPNDESFMIAIKTCLLCGDHVRAEALLHEAHKSGLSVEYLDQIRSAWAKVESPTILDRAEQLLARTDSTTPSGLDVWDVNLVLAGLARSGDQASVEMLENIYEALDSGSLGIDADRSAFFTVVAALAKSGKLEQAEQILLEMAAAEIPDLAPNGALYTKVVEQWIRLPDLERAESLLESMLQDTAKGNTAAQPEGQLFVQLVNAWIDNGDVVRAHAIFDRMQEQHRDGHLEEGASVADLETLLEAWKKSEEPAKDERIETLALELEERKR